MRRGKASSSSSFLLYRLMDEAVVAGGVFS